MLIKKSKFLSSLYLLVLLFGLTANAFANLTYKEIEYPKDDKSHFSDPQIITEWWYFTGKLTAKLDEKIKHFSYYVILRYMRDVTGNDPSLEFQLTDLDDHKVYNNSVVLERVSTYKSILNFKSKNFKLQANDNQYYLDFKIPADKTVIGLNLTFTPRKSILLIGPNATERGLVPMGNNTNSFYYSIPRLSTTGYILIGENEWTVNPSLSFSSSWMDHQWGDFSVPHVLKTNPWVWMEIQLSNGMDINVGQFISPLTGKGIAQPTAALSKADGKVEYMPAKIIMGPRSYGKYPLTYTVKVKRKSYQLKALVPEQHKNNAWFGMMSVNGKDIRIPNGSFANVENTLSIK